MKNSNLHLALREMRGFVFQPRVLIALGGAAILATVAQPFGFRVPGHIGLTFIYWLLVIGLTFPAGNVITIYAERTIGTRSTLAAIAGAAVLMGLLVTVLVYGLNMVFLSWRLLDSGKWASIAASAFPTAVLITLLIRIGFSPQNAESNTQAPRLLDRLPHHLRGTIHHLAAEDHYTKVTTSKGGELILLRFTDAVAEVEPTKGLQVHRSHWVALTAIADVRRQGDGAQLHMIDGSTVPVSRSKLGELKKMGLL